jgi:hypothetical protein
VAKPILDALRVAAGIGQGVAAGVAEQVVVDSRLRRRRSPSAEHLPDHSPGPGAVRFAEATIVL